MSQCQSEVSDESLLELQKFLDDHMENEGCMPLDVAHGCLTALYSGPRLIDPGEWLPLVLGKIQFLNDDEGEHIIALLLGVANDVEHDLNHNHYGPVILYMPVEDNDPLPLPYGWCQGYLIGLGVQGESVRDEALNNETAASFLAPILTFMMYEDDEMYNPKDEVAHRQTAIELATAAMSLYHWWHDEGESKLEIKPDKPENGLGFEVH